MPACYQEIRDHVSGSVEHVVVCQPQGAKGEGGEENNLPVILVGVNEDNFRPSMKVLLGGSSLGQCVSTLLSVLQTNFGVVECDITMIQANTNNNTLDGRTDNIDDWRAGRGAGQNIIPSNNNSALTEEVVKVSCESQT